jgi:hypothetical protein
MAWFCAGDFSLTMRSFLPILFALALSTGVVHGAVDFARDIFPIFQRSCFECHDAKKHKGDLRLDDREQAFASDGVIVKGDVAKSELYARITLPRDHDDVMPSRGEPLSKVETELIKRWIEAGAVWPDGVKLAKHWAYVAPIRPVAPALQSPDFKIQNPIDAFILARLDAEKIVPSPEADPATLLRRLSLDLLGLPPTPEEIDAFMRSAASDLPSAIAAAADRLLASPQFGVRWARPWLDYARYADSHGFQRDDFRDLWPYRDWVVDALNANLPFDQFTIEQLAGDLLPNATEAQRIATGFNRSAPTNVEAGSDPEETRVNQVHDRVNTLGMIWLGATLECAQCHDHKYDPFSQREYYGLFSFFNSTSLEADRSNPKTPGSIQFLGPQMPLTDAEMQAQRTQIEAQIAEASTKIAAFAKASAATPEWEATLLENNGAAPSEQGLEIASFESLGGATSEVQPDKSVLVSGEPAPDKDTYVVEARTALTGIRGIKLEALTDDSLPGKGPGRGDENRPNFVLNSFTVTAAPTSDPERAIPVSFVSATASFAQAKFDVANLLRENDARGGWAINPKFHEPHWAIFETAAPVGFAGGTVLRFRLEQNYGGGRTIGRLRLTAITGNVGGKSLPGEVTEVLRTPAAQRTVAQVKVLADFRLRENPAQAKVVREKTRLEAELRKLKPSTTLVMQELSEPRMNAIFDRGDFRSPVAAVMPSVPAILHPLKSATAPTRLDLARWLVSRENPLVARVTVNRWWAEIFGHGLVTTPEDFGLKGERPTHPELLDWLAVEFMENGWSFKKLLKLIVTSRTYRQASRISPDLLARDDRNLLYARGPRFRLDAEAIRDNALAVSGLLSLSQGGKPIRPYQPDGLWVKVGGQKYDYELSPGEEKYRRGLYVVWKRAAPYPSFVNFDANARMACRVKRPRSNTPLQALTLMNDPVYVEAAMAFARRILTEYPTAGVNARIARAFRLATARTPRAEELATLHRLLEAERAARIADPKGARELVSGFEMPAGTEAAEFAAWYAVAAALLNLDETITKG